MHKSTMTFAALTVVLTAAVGIAVWQLKGSKTAATVEGITDHLSIPQNEQAARDQLVPASSAVLWDMDEASIKFEQNGFERRPIASITKLMTAMVAIDLGLNWETLSHIPATEYTAGSTLYLAPQESVSIRDLFYASLLGSANNATKAYVRAGGYDHDDFVIAMNRKAIELGLEQTRFTDVTGLDTSNVSTAYEVAIMASYAFTNYPEINSAVSLPEYTFITNTGREHTIKNTNKLITTTSSPHFSASKTGYLYEAGYCIVVRGKGTFQDRVAVILNSPSESQHLVDARTVVSLSIP